MFCIFFPPLLVIVLIIWAVSKATKRSEKEEKGMTNREIAKALTEFYVQENQEKLNLFREKHGKEMQKNPKKRKEMNKRLPALICCNACDGSGFVCGVECSNCRGVGMRPENEMHAKAEQNRRTRPNVPEKKPVDNFCPFCKGWGCIGEKKCEECSGTGWNDSADSIGSGLS